VAPSSLGAAPATAGNLHQHGRCGDTIPPFEPSTGLLPPGIHEATWEELVARFGWTPHRLTLLAGLKAAFNALRLADPAGTAFIDFFQRDRSGHRKGIVALDLRALP
jgi:hypothetical protein